VTVEIRESKAAPGRKCGECSLCCKLLHVEEVPKPAGLWCPHCLKSRGCSIYDSRPKQCQNFYCGWLSNLDFGDEWHPQRSKMVLFASGFVNRLGIHVDPGFPSAWRQEPYFSQLKQLARDGIEHQRQVVVYLKDRAIVILPHDEVDLGVLAPDDHIMVSQSGRYARKVPLSEIPLEQRGTWISGLPVAR
jgi:hypothetical protein